MSRQKKDWLFALVLTIPMILFFTSYMFYHPAGLAPSGFIQYDNAGYVAYAKQYLDTESFSLFYSNPFNDGDGYARIYFQSQTLLIALALKAGIPSGLVLILFTIFCSFICFRLLIAIYDQLVPDGKYKTLSCILLSWGGGLFVIAGSLFHIVSNGSWQNFTENLFSIDPGYGWWGLSLGRSLYFSCEAYYHLLFLGTVLLLLKKKWKPALLVSFLLSVSHPFTGTELLCILCGWLFVEKVVIKNKTIPGYYAVGTAIILVFHIFYYLYYLNRFPDHRSVSGQYALNWYITLIRMLPAYAITGALAIFSILKAKKDYFLRLPNRLFLCWFIISFLLAKHELFMNPMQPIHFTRGYIWTSLFLAGLPALHNLFSFLRTLRYGRLMLGIFSFFFLLDNFVWIANYSLTCQKSKSASYITAEENKILDTIQMYSTKNSLLIGHSSYTEVLTYLALTRTKSYSWISHPYTTPFSESKKSAFDLFIREGIVDPRWKNRDIIFLFRKNSPLELKRSDHLSFPSRLLIETDSYKLITAKIPTP